MNRTKVFMEFLVAEDGVATSHKMYKAFSELGKLPGVVATRYTNTEPGNLADLNADLKEWEREETFANELVDITKPLLEELLKDEREKRLQNLETYLEGKRDQT